MREHRARKALRGFLNLLLDEKTTVSIDRDSKGRPNGVTINVANQDVADKINAYCQEHGMIPDAALRVAAEIVFERFLKIGAAATAFNADIKDHGEGS